MKITKIVEQQKNANRVSVFVDGKYSFSLSVDQLLETKLKVGLEINEARLRELIKLSETGKLRMRTLEWLMIRPHSAKELKDYLRRKKIVTEEADQLLGYFQKLKLQNDETFAKWWVQQRRNKQKSATFIRFELKSKGVKSDIIDLVLSDNQIQDNQTLRELIAKKRRQAKYQNDQKLMQYLASQGYNYSSIKEALAE